MNEFDENEFLRAKITFGAVFKGFIGDVYALQQHINEFLKDKPGLRLVYQTTSGSHLKIIPVRDDERAGWGE